MTKPDDFTSVDVKRLREEHASAISLLGKAEDAMSLINGKPANFLELIGAWLIRAGYILARSAEEKARIAARKTYLK